MNILITAPSLNPEKNVSGISTVVQTILEHNQKPVYSHYLLGRPDKKQSKIAWAFHLLKQVLLFPFALKKWKIDLVHQNLPFDPKGLTRESVINFWCWLMQVPVLLHVHGGVFLMNPPQNYFFIFFAKQLFKHSKAVVVLSDLEKEALRKYYHYDSAVVLLNSVDTSLFSSSAKQLDKDKPTLLFMGRIHESKGIEDMVEAFKQLRKDCAFRFVLCGDGPLKNACINSCREILGDDFEYRGVVSGARKYDTIGEANFFLLPSRYGEGLPMALLETMAAGVVPIVTDDASMKYVVQNEVNGLRVEKRNPQHLYSQVKKAISDKELYKALSYNAAETVKYQYDVEQYVIKLNEIYNSIKK